MALSVARARKLLLSFDKVTEAPHFDRVRANEALFIAAAGAAHARANQPRKSGPARR